VKRDAVAPRWGDYVLSSTLSTGGELVGEGKLQTTAL